MALFATFFVGCLGVEIITMVLIYQVRPKGEPGLLPGNTLQRHLKHCSLVPPPAFISSVVAFSLTPIEVFRRLLK
jgi:hypothetical protein